MAAEWWPGGLRSDSDATQRSGGRLGNAERPAGVIERVLSGDPRGHCAGYGPTSRRGGRVALLD